jgi:hypothetical protein
LSLSFMVGLSWLNRLGIVILWKSRMEVLAMIMAVGEAHPATASASPP